MVLLLQGHQHLPKTGRKSWWVPPSGYMRWPYNLLHATFKDLLKSQLGRSHFRQLCRNKNNQNRVNNRTNAEPTFKTFLFWLLVLQKNSPLIKQQVQFGRKRDCGYPNVFASLAFGDSDKKFFIGSFNSSSDVITVGKWLPKFTIWVNLASTHLILHMVIEA